MLWVNLIMDSLGSLALATEPPYDELLNRYPTKRNESIINGTMWKHILIQSLFELILLVFIYIYGPSFIKEDKIDILNSHYELFSCFGTLPGDIDYLDKYDNILDGREIAWSKTNFIDLNKIDQEKFGCRKFLSNDQSEWESFSLYDSFEYYNFEYGSTTHMTLIFNIFVFYTLLNQFNCRIINDSINIFSRINKGLMFCLVTFCEMSIQVLIVQFGYSVFHCVYGGLSIKQWQLCLIFSSTTFIVNFVTKFLPFEKMIDTYLNKIEKEENANKLAPIQIEMELGIEDNQSSQQGDENLINNIK
jgi:magnesium-transporting ATPase (P-type)